MYYASKTCLFQSHSLLLTVSLSGEIKHLNALDVSVQWRACVSVGRPAKPVPDLLKWLGTCCLDLLSPAHVKGDVPSTAVGVQADLKLSARMSIQLLTDILGKGYEEGKPL